MNKRFVFMLLMFAVSLVTKNAFSVDEDAIKQFNSTVNRKESKVMVRLIAKPTLANMDFASYDKNPLLYRQNFPCAYTT